MSHIGGGALALYWPVQLSEIAPSAQHVGMVTDDGIEIEAKALVFATGYGLAKGVPTPDIACPRPGPLPPSRSQRLCEF